MGCKIKVNRHGYLAFRIFGAGIPGGRSWEGTGLKDTPKNRAYAEAKATIINMQMKNNSFDYLTCFPHGNKVGYFEQQRKPKVAKTVAQYYGQWILRKTPPLVRKSLARDYKQHCEAYILKFMGSTYLEHVNGLLVEEFRNWLLQGKSRTVKTARNIIGGTLRALFRDAEDIDGLIDANPCEGLQWPRIDIVRPDPFTEKERDDIIDYFHKKKAWTLPFVYFQFWTGCRPSESSGLRWGDIDLRLGRIDISRSRHLKEDAATKTQASRRTLLLLSNVVEMLRDIKPLHAAVDTPVFLNSIGKPIDAGYWRGSHWHAALRSCNIRPRKFYNTRHTFISLGLSYGVNIKWLSEQCGTSVQMIERSYGRWMDTGKVQPQVQPFQKQNSKVNDNKWLTWRPRRDWSPRCGSHARQALIGGA